MHPNSLKNLAKPFEPGKTLNPGGKPIAARNKLSAKFLNALVKDFEEHGEQAIAETREKDPAAYLRVIAAVVPKELTLNEGETAIERILDSIGDSELATFVEGVRLLTVAAGGGAQANKKEAGNRPAGIH